MKKLLFILLTLPMLTTAQEKSVQVPPCIQGNAFTIKIPVKFPDSMLVQYAWYRNDTLIAGTEAALPTGEKTIAYTVPDTAAYGSAAYHFKYLLNDGCPDWTRSPVYLVNFQPTCPPIPGVISFVACNGVSDAGVISFDACSGVSEAGDITVITAVCNGVSDAGTVSFVGCNGITNAGTISFVEN